MQRFPAMSIENMTPDVYYGAAGQRALYERALEAARRGEEWLLPGTGRWVECERRA